MTTPDPTKLADQLRALLAKATPQAARERGESLTLRARHLGDSTEITTEHTADTVALLDDGFPNHEAVADLFVGVVNALPALLTRPTPPSDVADWWKPDPGDPFWMLEVRYGENKGAWLKNEHTYLTTRDPVKALRFPSQLAADRKRRGLGGTQDGRFEPTEHLWVNFGDEK